MRQPKSTSDVRAEAYQLALYRARERAIQGDAEGAGVILDLAASIKSIRLTLDVDSAVKVLTIGDLDLSVRTTNILGATSPVSLIDEVLNDAAHPLRKGLTIRDLKELAEVRQAVGAI